MKGKDVMTEVLTENTEVVEEKGGFVFFPSFKESVESLPKEQGNKLLRAIMAYGIDGIIVDDDPFIRALVVAIKPNIDHSHEQFKKAQERKKNWANKNAKSSETKNSSEPENKDSDISTRFTKEELQNSRQEFTVQLLDKVKKQVNQQLRIFENSQRNQQQNQYIR